MIELIKYIFLGAIQGLTESIPVSSSGHLMIFKKLVNLNVDFDTLAILTNFGSLIAIIVIFWNDIIDLFKGFFGYIKSKDEKYKDNYNYSWMLVIGCIPAGLCGLVVHYLELFDKIEDNIKILGLSLVITSILLFNIRNFKGKIDDKHLTIREALYCGLFQILGLFPGISRSGSTIVGGMMGGLKRDTAFKFSFLMYIPLSVCAVGLQLFDTVIDPNLIIYYIFAIVTAFIVTFITTKWFRKIVNEGKLIYFALYCFVVGILVILFL